MRLETLREIHRHIKAVELALLREIEEEERKIHKAVGQSKSEKKAEGRSP